MRTLAVSAALVAASLTFAQQVRTEQYHLPNGMKVILHEDHSLPMATVNIWYAVGSKDEPDRRSGFAHLFEHLMFMGTNRVPNGQFDQIMETAGGNNNASTTEDRTNYYSIGPSHLLPTLLWLDADRMESLAKAMTKQKLDLQRDVVRNERRENTENTPYGKAYEAINSLMFPKGHPYSWSVIGSHADLEAATVQNVKDFFNTYYVPNNASLVVAGDFRPAEIKPLIAKWFGTLPKGKDVPRRKVPVLGMKSIKRVTMTDQVQFPKTIMVWHSPAAYTPGDIALQVASAVLSNGLDSRLYERLVVKDKLASEVSTFQESRKLGSLFYVEATAEPGVSLDKIEKAIDDELARFRKGGPTADELQRVKAQVEFGLVSSLQSLRNKADQLNEYQFYFGDANSFNRVFDMYRNVTAAQIKGAAASALNPSQRLILRVLPAVKGRPMRFAATEQNPRDQKPTIPAPPSFAPQLPQEFSVGGMKVFYWNRPELPIMSLTTVFKGGAEQDPAAQAGRTAMMADMLDEGAGPRTAEQYENALEQLGASLGTGASYRATTVSMSVLASKFGKALALYSDALKRPRFDASEWARVKRIAISELEQQVDDPGTVARQVAMREYFGWDHPYGRPIAGVASTVSKLSLQDVKSRYAELLTPANATIFIAGSLPLPQVKELLTKSLATGWPPASASPETVAVPQPQPSPLRVVIVDKPASVQTVIRFVLPGVPYGDPRRIQMESLSTILGGSFTSRLNQNLRENKGYTYGAGSDFVFEQPLGYFVASASVRADVTGASIQEFLKEIRSLQAGDVTDQETLKARSIQRAGVISSMGSLQSMLGTAVGLYLNDRPFSELGRELTAISSVEAARLNRLAPDVLQLQSGVLVLVGDKAQILKQIGGLGLPQPVVVEPVK
jgi:predicted Zn-dependent peptidase